MRTLANIQLALLCISVFCQTGGATIRHVPSPYATIQAAINAAAIGDTVLVDEGTYKENIVITKKITVGSAFVVDGDTSHISRTIIDGSQPHSPDSAAVVTIDGATDTTTVLAGFTITGGKGNRRTVNYPPMPVYQMRVGMGVDIAGGGVRILHNIIRANGCNSPTEHMGGVINIFDVSDKNGVSQAIVEHNTIADNTLVGKDGEGGAFAIGHNSAIRDNLIARNSVHGSVDAGVGGAFQIWNGLVNIEGNRIINNSASHEGGGLAVYSVQAVGVVPHIVMVNNILMGNAAGTSGGGISVTNNDVVLSMINNTLTSNTAASGGSGLSIWNGAIVRALNTIFWDPAGMEIQTGSAGSLAACYCDIYGGYSGEGNIVGDPRFAEIDCRLSDTSYCIGRGTDSLQFGGAWYRAPGRDLFGSVRPNPPGSHPDIGACESPLAIGPEPKPLLGPRFLAFYERVTNAGFLDRSALVDSFMASNPVLPFIEDTIAQFIYRGPATTVNVPGDLNGWSTGGDPMTKLSTTDLWYLPRVFERDARIDYKFLLDGSSWILDPHNPVLTPGGFGDNSALEMPVYIPPWEIQYDGTIQHGRSEIQSVHSNIRGMTYSVQVYLPYVYDGSTARYPTAYFQDGSDYVTFGNAINVLDNLIAYSKIRPTIGVFVTPTNRNEEYAFTLRNQYQQFFVTELVPFIDSVYRTITAPSERAVIGDSYGGNISALISYNHPEVFGICGLQSGAFQPNGNEAYNLIVNGPVKPIKYHSIWGTYSDVAYNMGPFRDAMIARGYFFRWEERHEGHSWGQWRATIDTILQTFFPRSTGVIADRQVLPTEFMLAQNYPNPFNPSTTIKFELPRASLVSLTVYDILGRQVSVLVNERREAGVHEVKFDGSNLASGVYLCRLTAGEFIQTRKLILVR